MVDLNHDIKELLEDLAPLRLQFPDIKSTFPRFSLFGVNNSSNLILDGIERLSYIVLQIDAWDTAANGNTRQDCEQLAIQASDRMIAQGWKRDKATPFKDPSGLHRTLMQFSGFVDNVTGAVYQNSRF